MSNKIQLEKSILLCEKLKSKIEADCFVDITKIGGKTLKVYEVLRKNQLSDIEKIYNDLIFLYEQMRKV